MKFQYILFDLDGTLTDPYEGITNAVKYALSRMDRELPDGETLRKFIGPPLIYSFSTFCCMSEEEAKRAVSLYREYYSERGALENRLYDGIKELLQGLKEGGCKISLATSKPEGFSLRILEHFGILKYFDHVSAPRLSDLHPEKKDIIGRAIDAMGAREQNEACLMVGDRCFDIEGARLCNISSAGVLWGYGSAEEFEKYGADFTVGTPEEIEGLVF